MLESFIIGIGGIILLMAGWIAVQSVWRKHFLEYLDDDDDVLAGRTDCGNCGCGSICKLDSMDIDDGDIVKPKIKDYDTAK